MSHVWPVVEYAGLCMIVAAIGVLASPWWGILAFGVLLVLLAWSELRDSEGSE